MRKNVLDRPEYEAPTILDLEELAMVTAGYAILADEEIAPGGCQQDCNFGSGGCQQKCSFGS